LIENVAASPEDTNMIGVIAAGMATVPGAPVDRDLAESVVRQRQVNRGAHVWHTLGHAVVIAHLVADFELTEYAAELIAELRPFRAYIGVIGQLSCVGPVALALTRLYMLTGNADAAKESVVVATDVAQRNNGQPTLLRCRVLQWQLSRSDERRPDELDEIAARAAAFGMTGLVADVRALRDQG
jgi:hypothetical protein